MRIMDYPKATEVVKGSTFMNVDSAAAGTKALELDDLRKELMRFTTRDEYYEFLDKIDIPWQYRRTIYRGKKIGDHLSDEQKVVIKGGSFKNMFIGDYWEIANNHWMIADINYWLSTGDTGCFTHHLVLVPRFAVGPSRAMNDSDTTTGGYLGSKMIAGKNIKDASDIIYGAFGDGNIINHREIFSNSVSNGLVTGGIWSNSYVDLMNEFQVYGTGHASQRNSGSGSMPYIYTVDKVQFSLFSIAPRLIILTNVPDPAQSGRMSYWLRDIVSSTAFAAVSSSGHSNYMQASNMIGIRPCFGIHGNKVS